jgi:hypothetical protein
VSDYPIVLPQVNKIRRIVIASVLKPADEPRMYEKYARSLAAVPGHDIHVIGFPPAGVMNRHPAIQVHALAANPFSRISITRMLAPLKFLMLCFRIKPQVIIITTHELLIPAVICKLFHRMQVMYDVQENYYRNIRYGSAFPGMIKPLIGAWVRTKEWLTRPWISLYVLAEQAYASEIPFMKPACVVPNKMTRHLRDQYKKEHTSGYHRLIFSGTLADTTGVFQAIEWFRKLYALDNRFSLTLIGHCTIPATRAKLNRVMAACTNLIDCSADYPVPHQQILQALHEADVGIVYYPGNPSTQGSVPTKVYEYLALNLPMLIHHTPAVHDLVRQHQGGLILDDFSTPEALLSDLQHTTLPYPDPSADFFWESDFEAVLAVLK